MINKVKENSSAGNANQQPSQDPNTQQPQQSADSQAPADANAQQPQQAAQPQQSTDGQQAPSEQAQAPADATAQQPQQAAQPQQSTDGQQAPSEQAQAPADANTQQAQAPADATAQQPQEAAQPQQSTDGQQASSEQAQAPVDANTQQAQAPADANAQQPQQVQPNQQANPDQAKAQEANKELEKLDQQQEETSTTFASKNISKESASMLNLLMEQIKALVEVSNNLNERTREVEKRINEITVDSEKSKEESKIINEKMDMMEKNMEKFIGLYEVVTNQYNPFLESSSEPQENATSTVEEEEEIDSDDVEVQQVSQSNASALPTATEITPNQQNQPGQEYSGGASFNFEDRITGESGFVGNPSQQNQPNQQYGPQGFQSNFQPNAQYGQQGQNAQPQQFGQNQASNQFNPQQNNPQQFNPQQNGQQGQNTPPQQFGQNQANQFNPQQTSNNFQPTNQGYISPNQQGQNPMMMPTQKRITTLQDMLEELAVMDDNSFYNLVSGQRNEIANWIMNSLGNLELGTEVLKCRTRIETIKALSRYIHNGPQSPPQPSGFRFNNGKIANDIEEMMDELIYIDDATFAGHVNNQKNDIADWIQGSLNIPDLANRARGLTKKTDLIRELALYLHSRN